MVRARKAGLVSPTGALLTSGGSGSGISKAASTAAEAARVSPGASLLTGLTASLFD